MNKKIKSLWVKALRGGKYRQGYDQLGTKDGTGTSYCCLGVLRDIQGAKFSTKGFPGKKFAQGLTFKQCKFLAKMNDNKQKSFTDIADYIESNI